MSDALEFGVAFVLRVNKVLNFCHLELTHSDQTVSRSNFVPKSKTNLSSSERQSSSVELEQLVEINEHSLCCFRTQISDQISRWANFCLEHKVKRFGMRELISCFWRLDLQSGEKLSHFLLFVVIDIHQYLLVLGALLLLQFSLLQLALQPFSKQLIGPEPLTSLFIFHQKISKPGHVTRMLKHDMRCDTGGGNFKHLLLKHKMLPPQLLDIVPDGAANGTEVIESRTSPVDLKSLKEDVSPFDEILKQLAILLHQLRDKGGTLRPESSAYMRTCKRINNLFNKPLPII